MSKKSGGAAVSSKVVTVEAVDALAKKMAEAPVKRPNEMTHGDAVAKLAPQINAMLAKNYSREDVVAWLAQGGVKCTVGSLRVWLRKAAKESGHGTK